MRLIASAILATLALAPTMALAALVPAGPQDGGGDLPAPIRALAAWGFAIQRQMTGEMRHNLALLKDSGSWEAVAAVMLAAFLYGVFHAIGPGHGKVVIAGWFATRRAKVVHGLAASLIAAMVQSMSAIAAVMILAGVLALAPRDVQSGSAWLEVASYAVIAGVGAVMIWRTATGRGCGHHHDHSGNGAPCHHCGHDGHHPPAPSRSTGERNALFAVAAAVGFRPCSGAILVLLFTLANQMMPIGIMATFAMGLGVAITVAAIGMGALGLNRLIEARLGEGSLGRRVRTGLALAGAAAITLLGLALLASAVVNGPSVGT